MIVQTMGCVIIVIFLYSLFLVCSGVPASPTDTLIEDINGIKLSLKYFAGVAEKWNDVYNTQFEPRIVSTASALTGIDSNVRNLLERAHVWDTFQLHVSAWNDQLSATDRKLDIISKGQETLFTMDTKLNYISNFEDKLEAILKKFDKIEETISVINKKMENNCGHKDNLFGEFATRGIFSTLKLIERKLDKIQINGQALKAKQLKQNNDDSKGRFSITCSTPPIVEELLHDVSSKVDVIFDKFSEKYDFDLEEDINEYLDDQHISSGEIPGEIKHESDLKLFRRIMKRINQPCKQTNKYLEDITHKINVISNDTTALLQDKDNSRDSKSENCDIIQILEDISSNITTSEEKRETIFNSHFIEQRSHFEAILNNHLKTNCIHQIYKNNLNNGFLDRIPKKKINTSKSSDQTFQNTTNVNTNTSNNYNESRSTDNEYFSENSIDLSGCNDLPTNAQNGVYSFKKFDLNSLGRDYNTRYCEINSHGAWTVIQRRINKPTLQNFSLSWSEYKHGFGLLDVDFWYGNEFIHRLSNEKDLILRIELGDFEGNIAWAEYTTFKITSEDDNYRLYIGGYRGNASDSFSSHNFSQFSTFDRKNDEAPVCCPCAVSYGGGWWFNSCFEANLNGVYYRNPITNEYYRGIIWENWLGNYSLARTKMMVRAKTEEDFAIGSSTEESNKETTLYPYIEDP